jgi:hypothetical protein
MNPFISFCLYVAARVFVQYLKGRPDDQIISTSLEFLLSAMAALKRKNPLTESFLVQLDVDLDGRGIKLRDDVVSFHWYTCNDMNDLRGLMNFVLACDLRQPLPCHCRDPRRPAGSNPTDAHDRPIQL